MSSNKRSRRKAYSRRSNKSNRLFLGLFFIVIIIITIGAYIMLTNTTEDNVNPTRVLLTTSMGNILIELRNDMPITTENFEELVRQGIYDNTTFHRVIADFMIQGGDPTGTGFGDPSIPTIPDEFTVNNVNSRGTIAMANAGPDTGSSQFFINVVDNNHLDTKHPVFGMVIEGMDVVDAISLVPVEGENPIEDVFLIDAEIRV